MELWIAFTLFAAAAQTVRFMLQKSLSMDTLSAGGATLARFAYSAPLVAILLALYIIIAGLQFPALPPIFWPYAIAGGIAQILATMAVVALFAHRNFAVGITFKKTEVILTAIAGFVVLGDAVTAWAALAMGVGFLGVLALSKTEVSGVASGLFSRSAGLGILSGVFFAISAVGYRGAVLSLGVEDVILGAGATLAIVTLIQTACLGIWLARREVGQITAVARAWPKASLVGLFSMFGSFGWFAAFSLQSAAYVFAVGQVELIFSLLVSVLVFKERISGRELAGMALLTASIVTLVALG